MGGSDLTGVSKDNASPPYVFHDMPQVIDINDPLVVVNIVDHVKSIVNLPCSVGTEIF